MRDVGYYWVQIQEHWVIAKWLGDVWQMADGELYSDMEFSEIDETRIIHKQ